MVHYTALTNAMVQTLQRIPELTALLEDGADSIVGYVDLTPDNNSAQRAIYQMPLGSLLVIWNGTTLDSATDTMLSWNHNVQIFVRSRLGQSSYDIVPALVNGVPVPGDGLCWRYCPILDGLLPTHVGSVVRQRDEEGIDIIVVNTATQETGDL